jgi:hypothetical protein
VSVLAYAIGSAILIDTQICQRSVRQLLKPILKVTGKVKAVIALANAITSAILIDTQIWQRSV